MKKKENNTHLKTEKHNKENKRDSINLGLVLS